MINNDKTLNGHIRVLDHISDRVIPTPLNNQLTYFENMFKGRKPKVTANIGDSYKMC